MARPKIALYLRLSRDDERLGESSSIESQRAYLNQGWTVATEYVDDGWSGLTFDRPQFQRMLADIEAGQIDTVLTKDLSRLGRDQIYTAYYYQIYFPQRQVRYIAVSEGLDTAGTGTASALFPFLTAANDFYTADVSRKVRAALTARKREGKFIGASPPLGYQKDPDRPGHLIVEEPAAEIVRHIFTRYHQTGSVTGVAKELTEQGVPTPAQYRGGGNGARFPGVWNGASVRRILTNPTYAGHLTQNRREKVNYKLKQYRNLPRDAWITVPNTHTPIIDQALYDQVQTQLALRSYHTKAAGAGHLLTGLACCADCGSPMTYLRESPTRTYMVCQGYRKGGRLKLCTSHCIREDRVIEAIREELKKLAQSLDTDQLEAEYAGGEQRSEYDHRAARLERALERQKAMMQHLYEDRSSELLTDEEFRELFQGAREKRAAIEGQLLALTQADQQNRQRQELRDQIRELLSFQVLDRSIVTTLIHKILICEDKRIILQFRFQQPE